MSRALSILLLMGWGILTPMRATAEACAGSAALVGGPVEIGLFDGHHGASRHVCPQTEIDLGGGGYLLIDRYNYYGNIRATGELSFDFAFSKTLELYVIFEVIRYQLVKSSISDSALGFGHTTVGATRLLSDTSKAAIGVTGQVVVPTAQHLYRNALPFGFDLGLQGEYRWFSWLGAHAQLGTLFSFAASSGPPLWRAGITLDVGATWQPFRVVALVVDLSLLAFYYDLLRAVSVSIEMRFAIGQHARASLGGLLPIAGKEMASAVLQLKLGWVF